MNKKVLEKLAVTLNLDAELLAQSISSEKEDENIELPKLFTEVEVNSIKENIGKDKYDEGATASREMLFKELSDKGGLSERVKDRDGFLNAYKDSILKSASLEPNKRVEELETSVNKLQGMLTDKEVAMEQLESSFKQKETKLQVGSLMPKLPDGTGLTASEASSLFFLSHEIKDDGIYRDGVKLKDSHEKTLDLSEAVGTFVSSKGWDKEPAPTGRGGGSGSGTPTVSVSSLADYESMLKEKGINVGSEEANSLLKEMAKENPEILN